MGGAVLGSVALFGSGFAPVISRALQSKYSPGFASFAQSGVAYPSSSGMFPKPAKLPSLLYVGSLQQGTSSLHSL